MDEGYMIQLINAVKDVNKNLERIANALESQNENTRKAAEAFSKMETAEPAPDRKPPVVDTTSAASAEMVRKMFPDMPDPENPSLAESLKFLKNHKLMPPMGGIMSAIKENIKTNNPGMSEEDAAALSEVIGEFDEDGES